LRALGQEVELVRITTTGDTSTTPLMQTGGGGLFTKEIQRALLDGRCDIAVHSLKDLPTDPVPELALAAVPKREDPADCLIARESWTLATLPRSSVIGTGSPRRRAQVLRLRPDLVVADIRGNVDTRLKKLESGQFHAILLAAAGLRRLGLAESITETLELDAMIPAVGQAALGLETRSDDEETMRILQGLEDPPTHAAVLCEREILRQLRAGCLAPVAAHARWQGRQLSVQVRVFSRDYSQMLSAEGSIRGNDGQYEAETDPKQLAQKLADRTMRDLADRGVHALMDYGHETMD
jgi:hydroxymethylbilane synthase